MKISARLVRVIGTIVLILLILLAVPFTVPSFFGYQMFEITGDSMKPDIPEGSLVFVKEIETDEIFEDDIITYYTDSTKGNISTHRVVEVDEENEQFITQGDASDTADANPVDADRVLGKVSFTLKNGAAVANFVNSIAGKIVLGLLLAIVIACWIASSIIVRKSDTERPKSFASNVIIVIALCLVIFSGYNLIKIFSDYKLSNDEYEKLADKYVKTEDESTDSESVIAVNWYEAITVDFDSLKSQNEDVCGWIYFENEDISYPIMYSGDNNYYLRKTFERDVATAGSIFLEGANNPDFNDCHTIIYGHNMKNLSMFGKLKYYNRDSSYYDEHQYFQILTEDKAYRYQIFSYETVSDDSDEYTVGFEPDSTFEAFVNAMTAASQRNTGIVPTKDDKIVTLSTCSTSGDTYRFVVHGVRVDEYDY